ncbi:MAG: 16S rRNA (guanine(527)-N(7))-methyltransferase RsmG [Litorilinea sp.]
MIDDTSASAPENSLSNPSASEPMDNLPESETETSTPAAGMELLRQGCDKLGLPLSARQIAQFEQYYQLLVEWNARINLTAITDYADVQVKHFLDSLAALPIVAEEFDGAKSGAESGPESRAAAIPTQNLHIVDVGSGAGFPGIPLQIVAPHLRLTLMDGTGKKVQFLRTVVETLGLAHTQVVQGRAEELARQSAYRGQFDVVTARAVAPLNILVEYLLPLARRNGFVVAFKGGSAPQEFIDARNAIETLGGEPVRFAPVQVPFLNEQRFILLIKKMQNTPGLYPRGQGMARKKPL